MSKENHQDNQNSVKPLGLEDIFGLLNALDTNKEVEVTKFWGAFSVFWASQTVEGVPKLSEADRQKLANALFGKFGAAPSELPKIAEEQLHT